MTDATHRTPVADPLERRIDMSTIAWSSLVIVGALIAAGFARLSQLGANALSREEATRAFDAWLYYSGTEPDPGRAIANVAPAPTILEALGFFLFGAGDAAARFPSAILGIGVLLLALGLRPLVGGRQVAGMIGLMAISPTLVFISRTVGVEATALFALMLILVGVLRAGLPGVDGNASEASRFRWAIAVGVGLGLAIGSGEAAISGLLALAAGFALASLGGAAEHPVRRSLIALRADPRALMGAGVAFLATLLVLFTRVFSDISALAGLPETFADWARLLTTAPSTTPTQFFVLSVLLYEFGGLVLAVAAVTRREQSDASRTLSDLLGGWFLIALVLFSLSAGRAPEHVAYIALPLILLGGIGLGDLAARIQERRGIDGRAAAFIATGILALIAFAAVAVLTGRAREMGDSISVDVVFVLLLVAIPAVATLVYLARIDNQIIGASRVGSLVLVTVTIVFLVFGFRAMVELSYANLDAGSELLAQETSTPAVRPLVQRLNRLGIDLSRTDSDAEDPTGGHGLVVAIDRRVEQPMRWYLRDFPNATVVPEGQAAMSGAQVVIAPDESGMTAAGYAPESYALVHRIPVAYTSPSFASVLRGIFSPSQWQSSVDYLIFRDLDVPAQPEAVLVGFDAQVATTILPNTGPFGLFERPGAGDGRGQLDGPRGMTMLGDGTIIVVDSRNGRLQRYDLDGNFLAVWDAELTGADLTVQTIGTGQLLGPTGLAVGADGTIYIADTWGHRITQLDPSGRYIGEFGGYGNTEDAPTAEGAPGLFFGPRSVVVHNNEIFVADTGNERIQVFALDGSLLRAFGGLGSAPGQLIEPVGITIGPDGNLYVADSGNLRISVFTTDGAPVTQWPVAGWASTFATEPYIAFGPDGLLYVTSANTSSIEVYATDGAQVGVIFDADGQALGRPMTLAFLWDGALLVADDESSAVFRFYPPIFTDPAAVEEATPPPAEPTATEPAPTATEPAPTATNPPAPTATATKPAPSPTATRPAPTATATRPAPTATATKPAATATKPAATATKPAATATRTAQPTATP